MASDQIFISQGSIARTKGIRRGDCPYPLGFRRASLWLFGWDERDRQLANALRRRPAMLFRQITEELRA